MTDEEMLRYIRGSMGGKRADATDYLKELQEPMIPKRTQPMNAGAVYDVEPEPYEEGEEPEYAGAAPMPPIEQTSRDRYQEDADRVRSNRLADPYEDRGIFNFKLDDIRDALRWGKGDEVGDDALYSLNESENPFKGIADAVYQRIKGLNPDADDFDLIRQMRQKLNMSKPSKLYDMVRDDDEFRAANPGRGGMFRLDEAKGDPAGDRYAYPQRGGRARRGSVYEE